MSRPARRGRRHGCSGRGPPRWCARRPQPSPRVKRWDDDEEDDDDEDEHRTGGRGDGGGAAGVPGGLERQGDVAGASDARRPLEDDPPLHLHPHRAGRSGPVALLADRSAGGGLGDRRGGGVRWAGRTPPPPPPHPAPPPFASVIDASGHLYVWPDGREALAAIECNYHGLSVQDTLQLHLGYRHFYIWEVL